MFLTMLLVHDTTSSVAGLNDLTYTQTNHYVALYPQRMNVLPDALEYIPKEAPLV